MILLRFCQRWLPLGGLLALAGGCTEKAADAEPTSRSVAAVSVAPVQRKPMPLTLDAVGSVEPIHTAAIRSLVTGTFQKIGFQEGQDVRQGDLLFEIDPRPFRNALESAEADLQKLGVQLENARRQAARYEALNSAAMVSTEQYQSIRVNERMLAAQVSASENAVANARLQLEYSSIHAPLAGRTGGLGAHEGDLVRANDSSQPLVTVTQMSPIYVTFGLPQQNLPLLTRYQAAGRIVVTASPVGDPDVTEQGELTFIDNMVEATTGTVKVKATFPNAANRLWPGQFATVRVTLAAPDSIAVPMAALQNGQKGVHVFVVKPDHTAELRSVTIERTLDAEAVIAKGLAEGETVVVDGQLRVLPGAPVELKDAVAQHPSVKGRKRNAKSDPKAESQ